MSSYLLLGPVLFQLPPFLRKDLPLLDAFLAALPAGLSAALEFRHSSWFTDDVTECLPPGSASSAPVDRRDFCNGIGSLGIDLSSQSLHDAMMWLTQINAPR